MKPHLGESIVRQLDGPISGKTPGGPRKTPGGPRKTPGAPN